MYCVKCEMPVKMEMNEVEEDDDVEVIGSGSKGSPQDEDDFDNMVIQRQRELKNQKSDELSKKMGEKLIQGWAMLEDVCFDCLFPLMRSRRGEIICVGCGPVNEKKQKEEEKVEEPKIATPEPKAVKKEAKKEEVVVQKPVAKLEEVLEKVEIVKEKKERREKSEKREKSQKRESKREHKREKPHRRPMRAFGTESRSTEDVQTLLELGNFDESLSLYSKMTALLHAELDKVCETGLSGNTEKVWEILALQKKVDKSKIKIVKNLAK
jgi:uncharacterized Zn finger protein (UPF0148 family)